MRNAKWTCTFNEAMAELGLSANQLAAMLRPPCSRQGLNYLRGGVYGFRTVGVRAASMLRELLAQAVGCELSDVASFGELMNDLQYLVALSRIERANRLIGTVGSHE